MSNFACVSEPSQAGGNCDVVCHPAPGAVRVWMESYSAAEWATEVRHKSFNNKIVQLVIRDSVGPDRLGLQGGAWYQNVGICGACAEGMARATRKYYIVAAKV